MLAAGCRERPAPEDAAGFAFGSHGTRPGQMAFPRAVCATRAGWLFVVDRSGRVLRFDRQGRYDRGWRLPAWENGTPTGVCATADRHLLLADTHYHRILEYDFEGNLLEQWGEYGEEEGRFIYPTDVALDREGNYYITEYGHGSRIQVFDADRRYVRGWGRFGAEPGEFHRPMALSIGADGEVVVADSVNHRLQVFALDGTLRRVIGGPGREPGRFLYPYDVCLDEAGRILVCEYGTHRVQVLDREGKCLASFGGPGARRGQFANPWGVDVLDGLIYVADTLNHRIQALPLPV